jgi:hypothetical protein
VSDKKKPPPDETPPPGHDSFKAFLGKLAKVPKSEIDEKEAAYQRARKLARKKAG